MAKTKRSGSAAQRRERERQQRQRRDDIHVSAHTQRKPEKTSSKRRKDRSGLYMIIGVIALIIVIIGVFIILSRLPASQTNTNPLLKIVPADATTVQQLTGVKQATWETIGAGGVKNPFQAPNGQRPLTGSNGHSELFYVGGEFCPHCAAERWAIINALSRFGTFSKLSQMQSYEFNISTFSFYGSSYSSQYVDFVPVEVNGNQLDSTGQGYIPLQQLTSDQQKTFNQYDSAGSFPFIDIGNRYIAIGASYDFSILLDKSQNSLTWQTIARALSNPKSPIAQAILGTSNYLTAGICNLTNQQPAQVCNSSAIQQIERTLSKTSNNASSSPLALVPAEVASTQRRLFFL
jgi:hypothetical protein